MKGLSNDQIKLITSKVIEIHEEQRMVNGKNEQSRRLRNTKLLLRNYRTFKKYEEKIKGESDAQWVEVSKKELLVLGEDLVSSIKQTTQRTLVMIRYLDQALDTLEFICGQEDAASGNKQFDILQARYVDGQKIAEIAVDFGMNERSVYKVIDAAAERLSVILFGVYGLRNE